MKTHTLFLLSTLLAFCVTVASAQDYAFKVLAVKGNNEVRSGEQWQPLKTGATLRSQDELKLGANGYVGLVHQKGRPLEVKEAGVHKVSALETRVGTTTSVLNKYTDFILSSRSDAGKRNSLTATGAVHRAAGGQEAIRVHLPEKEQSKVFNKIAVIKWDAIEGGAPYVVTLKNMFEDVLTEVETPGTTIQIDLNEEKYQNESAILVEVSSKSNAKLVSKQHLIKKLSPAELETIARAISDLKQEITEESAIGQIYLAGLYEQNDLLIDAIYSYEQAIKLEPDVAEYRQAYDEFLVRNSLK